ncbi:MAG TPA: methyltransferase domain-containing protein, partial [Verrucomicrobiae bacterium]|nr:methyltransferase domain-containing protein [Verrucomicrobiae bacterium]
MTATDEAAHRAAILDQFARQAIPFTRVPGHLDSLQLLISLSGAGPDDDVLDVACGPGIVSCAFARHARSVTGIDITPAMIAEARKRQHREGAGNI